MPGKVCVWQSINFTGEEGVFSGTNANWKDLGGGTAFATGSWNDCASSIFNNKSINSVTLWEDINFTGGSFCVAPMTGYSDFTKHTFTNGDGLNDAVSSDTVDSGNIC